MDRSEIEEQVIKILMEFASINGIVSIVSLKKQYDTNLKLWNREEVVDSEEKKVDMKKETDESMKVTQELFDAMKVNESFVNQANWSVIANYLFHSYYCEPDFCTISPLYSRIQRAFEVLSSSECYYTDIKANHLIYILYCLVDMTNQTSTV